MATKKSFEAKRTLDFISDDKDGNLNLHVTRTIYGMTEDEYTELIRNFDYGVDENTDGTPYVMQTYKTIIHEILVKMAENMVNDEKYRKKILSGLKNARKEVKDILENHQEQLDYFQLEQYRRALKGLDYCVPFVQSLFNNPITEDNKADVIFNAANILHLIHSTYYELLEHEGVMQVEE